MRPVLQQCYLLVLAPHIADGLPVFCRDIVVSCSKEDKGRRGNSPEATYDICVVCFLPIAALYSLTALFASIATRLHRVDRRVRHPRNHCGDLSAKVTGGR